MPLCIAFVHSRNYDSLWTPCARRAKSGDPFCAEHRDALDGAVIGFQQMSRVPHAKIQGKTAGEALPNSPAESYSNFLEITERANLLDDFFPEATAKARQGSSARHKQAGAAAAKEARPPGETRPHRRSAPHAGA
jgi:hypothetical protein